MTGVAQGIFRGVKLLKLFCMILIMVDSVIIHLSKFIE